MKSILLPMKPEGCVNTLNGKQTILLEKTAPKEWVDYLSGKSKVKPEPRTAYICCTKNGIVVEKDCGLGFPEPINGKVFAKFELRKIEPFHCDVLSDVPGFEDPKDDTRKNGKRVGYIWYIDDLVIFDEPKELSEFKQWKIPYPKRIKWPCWESSYYTALGAYIQQRPTGMASETKRAFDESISIKRAPKSWQYVEAREGKLL